jgi:hypothetical protein
MPSGEISFPGCPAPSLHETFFRKSFRHVNNDSDVGGFSIHLLSESSIHMPGILIQNLSERPIHIARNPHAEQLIGITRAELERRGLSAGRSPECQTIGLASVYLEDLSSKTPTADRRWAKSRDAGQMVDAGKQNRCILRRRHFGQTPPKT